KARSHVVLLTRLTLSLSPDSLRATMKKFVALLLCLSLSIFTVARAMKPGHALAGVAKIDQKKPTGQKAGTKTLLNEANKALAAMIKADDDSMGDASDDDEGENMSDDAIWPRASVKVPGLELVSLSWESSSGRYLASEALNIKARQLRSRQSKGCS